MTTGAAPLLREVVHDRTLGGAEHLRLRTDEGDIACRLNRPDPVSAVVSGGAADAAAVLWVCGLPTEDPGSPPPCLYERLAERLRPDGIASLCLSCRRPGHLPDAVADVLIGVSYLVDQGWQRIALVGYAFGGPVVINAGAVSPAVVAVAAVRCQAQGTEAIGRVSPRPLLLIQNLDDTRGRVSPVREMYLRAGQPKDLILYLGGERHSPGQHQRRLESDLSAWLQRSLLGRD